MFQFGLFQQKPNDRDHKVRVALGNGLRGDVWSEFIRRFGDIHIYEFYASTEGNISFVNYTRKIGAVGRVNYLQRVSTLKSESIFRIQSFLKSYVMMMLLSELHEASPREVLPSLCNKDFNKIGCSNLKILMSMNNNPLCLCHLHSGNIFLCHLYVYMIKHQTLPVP